MAEVVSKRPKGPKCQMKITPRLACDRGPEKGRREQREKSPQTGPPQRGTCPPRRLGLGLSRVTFLADLLEWREQSLNEERSLGRSIGQQPSGSPVSQGPGGSALHRHHSQFPRFQGRQRNGGGDSYSKADVREWRFLSWLHLKPLGNFEQGTELLWASVSPYVRWREGSSLCWKEGNIQSANAGHQIPTGPHRFLDFSLGIGWC